MTSDHMQQYERISQMSLLSEETDLKRAPSTCLYKRQKAAELIYSKRAEKSGYFSGKVLDGRGQGSPLGSGHELGLVQPHLGAEPECTHG